VAQRVVVVVVVVVMWRTSRTDPKVGSSAFAVAVQVLGLVPSIGQNIHISISCYLCLYNKLHKLQTIDTNYKAELRAASWELLACRSTPSRPQPPVSSALLSSLFF
jgi:hypothetical protein